jgi:acyl-CoA synthetase (AMP-forming)/AMP-acid ligase II
MIRSAPALVTELLTHLAHERPDQPAFTWLRFDGGDPVRSSYLDLYRRSVAIASSLARRGLRGHPVLLVHPAGPEFAPAFFGSLMAGAIAVPVPVPRFASQYHRLEAAAQDCHPHAVLSTPDVYQSINQRLPAGSELREIPWLTSFDGEAVTHSLASPDPDDIAFLQYTSGSTSHARGVAVSHANLAQNVRMISEEFNSSFSAKLLSWLPHFHDMGLIGSMLTPMAWASEMILMSPQSFLQRPLRWLGAISQYGVEISGAPNFAYELCVKAAERAGDLSHLDLSSWRIAFVGAEPIRASTLSRFVDRFAPYGFRRSALLPCYGLAEATLMVTCKPSGTEYTTYKLLRASLEKHIARPAKVSDGAESAVELVGCGYPPRDTELRIIDPATGEPLDPGVVGEICASGPQVTHGYWNEPPIQRPFLRTGDLGFLTPEGELVFVERLKDLLVLNGQNFACADLEQTVAGSHARLNEDAVAVALVETQSAPHLVAIAEIPFAQAAAANEIAQAVRSAMFTVHGLAVKTIGFVPTGKISRTTSGKMQRRRTVQRMVNGETRVIAWCGEPIPDFLSLS